MTEKQTAGHDQLGEFAPLFAHLNDDVLFGQVWSRQEDLNLKTRAIVTVTALVSQGLVDESFRYHLVNAKDKGVTKTEIAEILTQLAFYSGWPKAWAAFRMAKEIWADEPTSVVQTKEEYEAQSIFPIGESNETFAPYFIGISYLAPLSTELTTLSNVTFEPGCRNNWHIHHASSGGGQQLICVGGRGWVQEEGKPAVQMLPGDVINIKAGVKHWHGAAKDSWFSHLAIMIDGEDLSNEWLEPVDDQHYLGL